jgi:hypothetical protein
MVASVLEGKERSGRLSDTCARAPILAAATAQLDRRGPLERAATLSVIRFLGALEESRGENTQAHRLGLPIMVTLARVLSIVPSGNTEPPTANRLVVGEL